MFGAGHLLSMLTLGTNTGLVIDLGYSETVVVPVSLDRVKKNHVDILISFIILQRLSFVCLTCDFQLFVNLKFN